jgi:hypothetical protein
MWRRVLISLAVVAALLAGSTDVHAKKKKRKKGGDNLPAGFVWPVNKAMKKVGKVCLDRLDELAVPWKSGKVTDKVATPVLVPQMELAGIQLVTIYRKPPFVMDCHLAAALAEHGVALHDLGVRTIKFSSIHRYTKVRVDGKVLDKLSRHALGLAIDVWSVIDVDGIEHIVKDDYVTGDELLLAIEQSINDSGAFRMVLTPANDPKSHDDHFHLEAKVEYPE